VRPVNLLPEDQRRREPSGDGRGAYALLGALAVLLVLTVLYVKVSNDATTRAADAAVASAEADALERQVAELGAFGDFAQTKEIRVASVRQLAASRFDWERMMRELARVMPAKGWLHSAQASVSGGEGSTAAVAGPSAMLSGCLPRQPDVADLMLRLRRMHRVEDVTLTESVLEDERGSPTLDSCGDYYRFDVTVVFAPAAPAEPPAGRRSVPAALGGGS